MEINVKNEIIMISSSSSNSNSNSSNEIENNNTSISIPAVDEKDERDDHIDDDDVLILLSDETYAEELQLQEAIMFSSASVTTSSSSASVSSSQSLLSVNIMKQPLDTLVEVSEVSKVRPESFCDICLDSKTESEIFRNKDNVCTHLFCSDCIIKHVAEKIKLNFTVITCPDPNCKGVIGPESCQSIVPKEVLERWENALCESLIMGTEKFYCPFQDCSAMLVDDGGETVTTSECPYCHRLFCAQCKVAWHAGLDCVEFKSVKSGEIDSSDILLMDLAKNKKWMRCPSCNFFVERIDGCLHITCRCKKEFCYRCGEDYDNGNHACAPV